MPTTVPLWTDRLSYSGEIPTNYPGLRPRAIGRMHEFGSESGSYLDGVDSSREWVTHWDGSPGIYSRRSGRTSGRYELNGAGADTERGRIQLDHFSNLWPPESRRRVLIGGWFWQVYEMDFNPLIDTRDTDPFVYLSTAGGSGQPRAQVYDESGSLIFDQYESGLPWAQTTEGYFLGMMVDGYDNWVRVFSVHEDGRQWIGPERELDGTPNWNCTADVHVFSLRSGDYWEAGHLDEIIIGNPNNNFELEEFVDDLACSVWADGQQHPERTDDFTVTDDSIQAHNSDNRSFSTGAERLSWPVKPDFTVPSGNLLYSTDDGETWQDADQGADLPETADGLLLRRENMNLNTSGNPWSGMDITIPDDPDTEVTPEAPDHDEENNTVTVTPQEGVEWSHVGEVDIPEDGELVVSAEPEEGYVFPDGATTEWTYTYTVPDPPTLGSIADVVLEHSEQHTEELTYEVHAHPHTWDVSGPNIISVSVDDGTLEIAAGIETGSGTVTITLTDDRDRSESQSFQVAVNPRAWEEGPPPQYPHAPIVLWGDDDPEEILIDALEATIINEVNGAETFEFVIPAEHRHAGILQNERIVEVAGERYWTRRITTDREDEIPALRIYAEARFYELSTAARIRAHEYDQVAAGRVMELALSNTDWTVDVVDVTTLRTYSFEETNPLELLRTVQENHGGDLIFDNTNRTVSLVTQSGRDNGVAFFYGHGLTAAKRVVDTTSLVTRIYPRNADGLGIESVNNGQAYVEDYSYTDEVREVTYEFKSGTSPHTMLSMANATLANRCQPDYSYEVTVNDLSALSGEDIDRFDAGDRVTVVDEKLGIEDTQRITRLEYDVIRPWASQITLSGRLRETGSSDSEDAGDLQTGAGDSTFDLVPFNLLLNSRFDNGLAHWASNGAEVVETEQGTGDYAVRFEGSGERWIEQTVQPDNRTAYAFSFDLETDGETGWEPDLVAEAEITYEDGDTETIQLDLN